MKKVLMLAVLVCVLAAAGALCALNLEPATEGTSMTAAEIAGLPTTVLDDLVVNANCPRKDIYCLDVWDPVTCSNGVTYSNACYAYVACATGCTGGGASS